MVAPICYLQSVLMIVNFQGHVLDLANSVNPIIAQTPNPTISNNQIWTPIPVTSAQTTFIFESSAPIPGTSHAGIYLSYAGSSDTTGVSPLFLQASGETFSSDFNLDCVNATSGYILEATSGLALTAWAQGAGSTISPVTYETWTGRAEQVWTFQTVP